MIILGSTSEVAQAFVEKALTAGKNFLKFIWLLLAEKPQNVLSTYRCEISTAIRNHRIGFDSRNQLFIFENVDSDLLFCATGYLGLGTEDGLYDDKNTEKIIDINYAKLVPVINYFAKKWKAKEVETLSRFPL